MTTATPAAGDPPALPTKAPLIESLIVTRFNIMSTSPMLVGQAQAASLNHALARRSSKGRFVCRFNDLSPSFGTFDQPNTIVDDLKSLNVVTDRLTWASDHFNQIYQFCVALLQSGNAYVDEIVARNVSEVNQTSSQKYRDMPPNQALLLFHAMNAMRNSPSDHLGQDEHWCIRAKAPSSHNKDQVDPVIYVADSKPHRRTGTEWSVYPTIEFSTLILDALDGITHVCNSNSKESGKSLENQWILSYLGLQRPASYTFSSMPLVPSNRTLVGSVNHRFFEPWGDLAQATVQSLLHRGMRLSVLQDFLLTQTRPYDFAGVDMAALWATLWAANAQELEKMAPRHTAINKTDMVVATIKGADTRTPPAKVPRNPKNVSLGNKEVSYSPTIILDADDVHTLVVNEFISLTDWGIASVEGIITDVETGDVLSVQLELRPEADVTSVKKEFPWLAVEGHRLIPVVLVDYLLADNTQQNVNAGQKENALTRGSGTTTESRIEALADCNIANLIKEDIVHFEYKGYYRVERPFKDDDPAELIRIPTGL